MAKVTALGALSALVVAGNWLRLESPRGATSVVAWTCLVALLPALAPSWRRRVGAAALAAVAVAWVALGSPFGTELYERGGSAFAAFYDVPLPFSAKTHAWMHGLVLIAIFSFVLASGLAIAARRPVLAAITLVVGAGWPATLFTGDGDLLRGGIILAAALALLAAVPEQPIAAIRPAVGAGLALVAAAVAVSTTPAVAKGAFLSWEHWDPFAERDPAVGVRYVWNSHYGAVKFPEKKTTVLSIKAGPNSPYWRATTLDSFNGDHWLEELLPPPPSAADDPLVPRAALERENLSFAHVTVRALNDDRLVGASIPVAYRPGSVGATELHAGGVASAVGWLRRNDTYGVWSYSARPRPRQLARVPPVWPRDADYFLTIQDRIGLTAPRFGAPGRDEAMASLFAESSWARRYRPLYERARRVVGDAPSPYAAAIKLENWLRLSGRFRYDATPPRTRPGRAPLVAFVTRTRRGHCQHYAGAMALMLRYLGIPARVAVGFTTGEYDTESRTWTVTDHDAHAWVEVWFRGYGWLPFDPTPGRGRLSASYTSSSINFDFRGAVAALRQIAKDAPDLKLEGEFGTREAVPLARDQSADTADGADTAAATDAGGAGLSSLLRLLALLAATLAAGIALSKLAIRRARLATRDPRRLAAACRQELADFLADQRFDVPASATLAELGELVDRELGANSDPFVIAATTARFAPPRESAAAARRARRELTRLERRLRSRLTRGERARGLFSLRSLGFA